MAHKPIEGPTDPSWAWGRHAVFELLRTHPGQVEQVVLALRPDDRLRRDLAALCTRNRIPLVSLDPREFDRRFPAPGHQSVAARLKNEFTYVPLDDLLERTPAAANPPPLLLVVDHLQDPQNLGAIIRTAYCAGVDGIIIPKDRSCSITGTVRKAAAGALEHLPLVQVTNLAQTIDRLQEKGFWILSLDAAGASSLYQVDLRVPLAVVVGSEGQGVSPLVLKKSDWTAAIPLAGKLGSLNASVACAVALFEVLRQKRSG